MASRFASVMVPEMMQRWVYGIFGTLKRFGNFLIAVMSNLVRTSYMGPFVLGFRIFQYMAGIINNDLKGFGTWKLLFTQAYHRSTDNILGKCCSSSYAF